MNMAPAVTEVAQGIVPPSTIRKPRSCNVSRRQDANVSYLGAPKGPTQRRGGGDCRGA